MSSESDRTAILARITSWDHALYHKDMERLASFYASNCTIFDVGTQTSGAESIAALWQPCLPFFGEHIGIERKNEVLHVAGDMALFTSYNRLTGMQQCDMDAAKAWLRSTVVMQKIDGSWQILHEHISFPFDCEKEKPAYILDK